MKLISLAGQILEQILRMHPEEMRLLLYQTET